MRKRDEARAMHRRALVIALVAMLNSTSAASAQERMQLGASHRPLPGTLPSDVFKASVGDRVFFSEGSAAVGARARVALEAQAAWLQRHKTLAVIVEGYADEPGTNALNLQLARERAEAVRRRLVELGVEEHRITLVAFGRDRRIADCASALCAAQNRRAITVVGQPLARPVQDTATTRGNLDEQSRRPRRGF
jgi:outer membrane protein OmpA-like peptidoglycan-associated protein